MNTELIVLGLISKNVCSGYDIMKQIKEASVNSSKIKYGSVYYALKKAVENGWIKKTGSKKEGDNPEKHIYKITPDGEKYLKRKSNQYFEKNELHFEADLTLMILNSIDMESIEEKQDAIKKKLTEIEKSDSMLLSYLEHHLKAEFAWLKSLKINAK